MIKGIAEENKAPFHSVADEAVLVKAEDWHSGWKCTIKTPLRTYLDLELPLPGRHQLSNLQTAIRASEIVLPEITQSDIPVSRGLRSLHQLSGLRGRLDIVQKEPGIILDVGHNCEGLSESLAYLKRKFEKQKGRLFVAFSAKKDKDNARMLAALAPVANRVFLIPFDDPRSARVSDLSSLAEAVNLEVSILDSVTHAADAFLHVANPEDFLLITGSHQIVASYLKASQPPED